MADTKNGATAKTTAKYTKNYDVEEANPLHSSTQPQSQPPAQTTIAANSPATDHPDATNPNKVRGAYESMMTRMDISKKARLPFILLISLCALLLVVFIIIISFWPRIPGYMKAAVCVEKECLESSSQILLWANISADACQDPYEWACGRFESEFQSHHFNEYSSGEWNVDAYAEYNEIDKINTFVGKLPSSGMSYSAQFVLKTLSVLCRDFEKTDVSQIISSLKKAIKSLDGWRNFRDGQWSTLMWNFKKPLTLLQSRYGVSPFFKISVESNITFPYDSVIVISNGDLTLPDSIFYTLESNHKIIKAYKMLLRDFAINMGVVSDQANLFAEEIYGYEKRLVNTISAVESGSANNVNVVMSLGKVQSAAPMLPILDTIKAIFAKSRINENTQVMVRNLNVLQQLSIVLTSSDKEVQNDYIVWSLSYKYMPYMPQGHRSAYDEFHRIFYGQKSAPPKWYFCSKLQKDWMPFAIEALHENPHLISMRAPVRTDKYEPVQSSQLKSMKINYNHELAKMVFYHIRDRFKNSINKANWISEALSVFINEKISEIKIQIGIPHEIIKNDLFINNYYEYLLHNYDVIEHLESRWSFVKTKLEQKLGIIEPMTSNQRIISTMFPVTGQNYAQVKYVHELNTIMVSGQAVASPKFNFKYPIGINFARLGVDLTEALLDAAMQLNREYLALLKQNSNATNGAVLFASMVEGDSIKAINRILSDDKPSAASEHLFRKLTSGRFTINALRTFIKKVYSNEPIPDTLLPDGVTYELFGLATTSRQPGLRLFEQEQLFSLAYMQRHCSVSHGFYKKYKPYVEGSLPERDIFDQIWQQCPAIPESLLCSTTNKKYLIQDIL